MSLPALIRRIPLGSKNLVPPIRFEKSGTKGHETPGPNINKKNFFYYEQTTSGPIVA
jgi:hypothetical protein